MGSVEFSYQGISPPPAEKNVSYNNSNNSGIYLRSPSKQFYYSIKVVDKDSM